MLPEAFLERMQRLLGDEYEDFLQSFEQEKHQALRLNALKVGIGGRSAVELAKSVHEELPEAVGKGTEGAKAGVATSFAHLTKVPWAENGYYYQVSDQPGKHPFHEAGLYYIQEPSAMAPVELLGVEPGERVLDLCAAPGGKSTQIAAKLKGKGLLVCNEIHPARAKILSENVERMGIGNACVTNETPARLAEFFPEYFDRILVDAPCSGEGMFRKNEVACDEWSPENVELCAQRQDEILDCAARMLRPGGRLVYSTCTFAPAENEGSISRFLDRHSEFEILPIDKDALGLAGGDGRPEWADDSESEEGNDASKQADPGLKNTLRLWPHKIKGEGHYAAVLQKAGSVPEGYRAVAAGGIAKPVAEKELGAWVEFCRENLMPGACDMGAGCAEEVRNVRSSENSKMARNAKAAGGSETVRNTKAAGGFESARNAGATDAGLAQSLAQACGIWNAVQYLTFGDNIYLVGADMPSLKGLKVLRPGLHLGEMKKNRFEPAHALALALCPDCAAHTWQLDSADTSAKAYLNGQTFPSEGEKGWYLICVDGFSLGWGKLAGGIMKNHYPKGLRR